VPKEEEGEGEIGEEGFSSTNRGVRGTSCTASGRSDDDGVDRERSRGVGGEEE